MKKTCVFLRPAYAFGDYMSVNYLLSLMLVIFSGIAIYKIISFSNTNKNKHTLLFRVYAFLLFLYSLSYALEIASYDLELMKLFNCLKIVSISFLPAFVLLMFLDVANKLHKVKAHHYILLFIIPLATAAINITSKYHSMFYYNFSLQTNNSIWYLAHDKGFWFYFFSAYIAACFGLCIASVIKWFPKNKKNRATYMFLLGVIFAVMLGVIIKTAGENSLAVFFIPFMVPLFSILLSSDYLNQRLFNSIPLAYKKAFDWSDNCILILNNELNLVDYNAAARKSIPLISEDMLSKNICDFLDYDGRVRNSVLTGTECRLKIIENYTIRHYRVSNSTLLNNSDRQMGYMVSLIDITSLVEAMSELTELASIDTLTRVHTRRYFIQRAAIEFTRARRHKQPLSFIILDLDYFKKINDEFGHIAGDAMLKEIASICQSKIRSIDILGRFGGEEFIILLPETDIEGAVFVAERIRKTIEETEFIFENRIMDMTVSLGVTGADIITDEDFDVFLKHADRALYRAKDGGRNRVEHAVCDEE